MTKRRRSISGLFRRKPEPDAKPGADQAIEALAKAYLNELEQAEQAKAQAAALELEGQRLRAMLAETNESAQLAAAQIKAAREARERLEQPYVLDRSEIRSKASGLTIIDPARVTRVYGRMVAKEDN